MPWLYLAIAIGSEIVSTLGLRSLSDGFSWWPAIGVTIGYLVSFTFLTLALKHINVGVSYAIWSAVGTAAVAIAGVIFFQERLNAVAIIGLVLIVVGVIVLTASGTASHG